MGCFQTFTIVNSAAINMGVQAALSYPGAHSFRYMLWTHFKIFFFFVLLEEELLGQNICTVLRLLVHVV
jgi:hypothetical protein